MVAQRGRLVCSPLEQLGSHLVAALRRAGDVMAALDRVSAGGSQSGMNTPAVIREQGLIRRGGEQRVRERQPLALELEDSGRKRRLESKPGDAGTEEQGR